jgi:nicotinate (nicotinamide) nucleotide adenylyltransferase
MHMLLNNKTCTYYDTIMNQLDPKGPPQAQLVYGDAPSVPAKIAILDASFNPMTLAHESLIFTAKTTYHLNEILLVLSSTNVDKGLMGATLGQRLTMLIHYAQKQPNTTVAICSHAKFTDKVKALMPCYRPQTQFFFIVGYDTLVRLFDPKYYLDMSYELRLLFETCHFIAANRGTNDAQTLKAFLHKEEVIPFADKIHAISLPDSVANISSTQVRERIRQHKTTESFVPKAILEAIDDLQLYQDPTQPTKGTEIA